MGERLGTDGYVTLPKNLQILLEKDLQSLAAVRDDLPGRALEYLQSGDDEAILNELATLPGCGNALKLAGSNHDARGKFFRKTNLDNPLIYYRLARLYSAASTQDCRQLFSLARWGEHDYLDPFLYQLVEGSPELAPTVQETPRLTAQFIADVAMLGGETADYLARLAYLAKPDSPQINIAEICCALPGFADYSLQHLDVIRAALHNKGSLQQRHALTILYQQRVPIRALVDDLIALSYTIGKKHHIFALLNTEIEHTIARLIELLPNAKVSDRIKGIQLAWQLSNSQAQPLLASLRETETEPTVCAVIDEYWRLLQIDEALSVLPPLPTVVKEQPLSEDLIELFRAFYQVTIDRGDHRDHNNQPLAFSEKKITLLIERIARGNAADCNSVKFWCGWTEETALPFYRIVEHPQLTLVQLVRLLLIIRRIDGSEDRIRANVKELRPLYYPDEVTNELFERYRATHPPAFTLRELAAVLAVLRIPAERIGWSILHHDAGWEHYDNLRFEADAVWPYFVEHFYLLEQIFNPITPVDLYGGDLALAAQRRNALRVLILFPKLPQKFLPRLWQSALGNAKLERQLAQKVLEKLPDLFEQVLARIDDKSQVVRLAAAEWLAGAGRREAVEPIKKLLQRESSEAARGLLMMALESLGSSMTEFIDRAQLAQEARNGLQKGIPPALAWFPFTSLPPVHWRDTGEVVEREILHWLIVQAFKQGNVEPGPLLRSYAEMFQPADRNALGLLVFTAWVEQDTIPAHTLEEAEQEVQKYYRGNLSPADEQFKQEQIKELLRKFKGNALKERGLLAIVAACAGAEVPPMVEKYINTYHGNRLGQGKALAQMLAWLDEPLAVQTLISLADRCRTKGIRAEAANQLDKLAARKGWTTEELGDRTIPSAGLGKDYALTLDYGPRNFIARLEAGGQLLLFDADGRSLKALPDARQSDDANKVSEAKKLFAAAKKTIKSVIEFQQQRFYEAMCTQYRWRFCDWDSLLHRHPIAGRCCQRLIWTVYRESELLETFRPLGDGSLTDFDDNPVRIGDDLMVRLAHSATISPTISARWRQHLADYQIKPLFDQFEKPLYRLPDEKADDLAITDFQGYQLLSTRFQRLVERLGYKRGDAGFERGFTEYRKRFRTLGCDAVINFSGMTGEVRGTHLEEYPITLLDLCFITIGESKRSTKRIPLKQLPPVLLSEIYQELQALAAAGSYDPAWSSR